MQTNRQICNPNQLKMFLEHQLNSVQTSEVELHLNDCEVCRRMLEELSASTGFWDNVGGLLANARETAPIESPDIADVCESKVNESVSDSGQDSETDTSYLESWLSPTDDPQSLGRLGTYEITGVVGRGGMAIVLKGFDRSLNRYVAIKVMGQNLSSSGAARQRFSREAQAAAAVLHENVLAIHGIDKWRDQPYLVMPYIRGESLENRLQRKGPMEAIEVLRIARQIASGLAAAHEQGLVHRDIKPANILLDEGSQRLKISDFGLARAVDDASLTHSGTITGTPLYMSPEQGRGEMVDARSDLFSLGSLLYALCTGHPPFRAETAYGIIRRICEDTPRSIQESRPELPIWLIRIIEQLLAKDRDLRIQNASELEELFSIGLAQLQQPATQLHEKLQPFAASHPRGGKRRTMIFVTIAVLGFVSFAIVSLSVFLKPDREDVIASFKDARSIKGEHRSTQPGADRLSPQLETIEPKDRLETQDNSASPVGEDSASGLAYKFAVGEPQYYRCDLTLERSDYRLSITGWASLEVAAIVEDGTELNYQLRFASSVDWKGIPAGPFSHPELNTDQDTLRRCSRQGRIKVDSYGSIVGRSHQSELPGQFGPLLDLMVPALASTDELTWSTKREVRLTVADPDSRIEFGPEQSIETIDVIRATEFEWMPKPEGPDAIQGIEFRIKDSGIELADTEIEVKSKPISGEIDFDSKAGRIDKLTAVRTNGDKLEIKAIDADDATTLSDGIDE